jgi:FMN phosphatase YigB (HAD superfamily)
VSLKAAVVAELDRHGITARPGETAESLRERLNERYLEDVRRLRERQRAGLIPLREYAAAADALKRSYPLLSLPASLWPDDSAATRP